VPQGTFCFSQNRQKPRRGRCPSTSTAALVRASQRVGLILLGMIKEPVPEFPHWDGEGGEDHRQGRGQSGTEAGRAPAVGRRRPSHASARPPGRRQDDAAASGPERAPCGHCGPQGLEQFGHLGAKDVPPSPQARPAGVPREGTTLPSITSCPESDYAPSWLADGALALGLRLLLCPR
jgi:hypothetical protein